MTTSQFQSHLQEFATAAGGAALTLDFSANGKAQATTLNSLSVPCVVSITNPKTQGYVTWRVTQDATGGRSFTLPAAVLGTVPSPGAAANATTVYEFYFNGTNYFCTGCTSFSSVSVVPLNLVYYVDGTAASGGNGSEFSPFQTIQQAINAAGANNATIIVAPGTYATNLVFPAAQQFNIQAFAPRFGLPVTISGTISMPVSTSTQWVDVGITGNVTGTGSAGGGDYFVLYRSYLGGTFTATSGGFLNLVAISDLNVPGNSYNQAWINGVVNTLGAIYLESARVDVSMSCRNIFAEGSEFAGAHTITTNAPFANAAFFGKGCTFVAGWTYTGNATQNLTLGDSTTAASYEANPPTLTNATTIVYGWDSLPHIASEAEGDILIRGVSTWVRLAAGTAGQFLKTLGTGALPAWATVAASAVTNDSATVSGAHVSDALDALKAMIAAVVAGVSSWNGRTGAVVPVAGDYAASKVNNDSATVAGTHVSDALDALKALIAASVTGVSSVYGRTGAVVAAVGDYAASKINNDSGVAGTHVSDALNTLAGLIAAIGSPVTSWKTRTGAVVPVSGDYAASQVTNDSTVIGTGVSGAINTLKAEIAGLVASAIGNDSSEAGTTVKDAINNLRTSLLGLVTGVSTVFGRAGAVVAVAGDYAASKITNDSATVSGAHVSDALDALKAAIAAVVTGVATWNGRSGTVVPVAGDYAASKITNDSLVAGAHASDALSNLLLAFPNGFYAISANFTLANSNNGKLGLNSTNGALFTCTIATQASGGYALGSKFYVMNYALGSQFVISGAVGVTVHQPAGLNYPRYTKLCLELIGADEWTVTPDILTSSSIADLSSVGGASIYDSLNVIGLFMASVTSTQVFNFSSVPGAKVTDALDTLQARGFAGVMQVSLVPVGDTGDFSFSIIDGWAQNAATRTGSPILFTPGLLPDGAIISAVTVRFNPTTGHTGLSGLPANMPVLTVYLMDGGGAMHAIGSVTDASSSVAAYETPHEITLSGLGIMSHQHSVYLSFGGEWGADSQVGLNIIDVTVTL